MITLIPKLTVWADIPKLINFQSVLADSGGNLLTDDTVSVEFRIYDVASGGTSINVLWMEVQNIITDENGQFSVLLGSNTSIDKTFFNDSLRWLAFKVGSEPEKTLRTQIVSLAHVYAADTIQVVKVRNRGVITEVNTSDGVKEAGNMGEQEVRVYEVFGMGCPSCHGGLEKLVNKIPGVVDCEANWKEKRIIVETAPGAEVNDEDILDAIKRANFTPGKQFK